MKKLTVLVTGGSSGIGREIVRKFAHEGYEVWFTYRSGADRAQSLTKELSRFPVRGFAFEQGNWDSQSQLLSMLPGTPDILIPNAALGSATVSRLTSEPHLQDQALMQVNAVGVLWLINALVPKMKDRGTGKIILMSSVGGGITQFPRFKLADGMSKAAIAFLARQLAAELAHTGIDVFAVCPGATETAMFEASTLSSLSEAEKKQFAESLPKKRLIQPEEIANLCLFLSRAEAQILHGAVLDASLGLGVHPGLITGKS